MNSMDRTHEQWLEVAREQHRTRTGKKQRAQEILMHGIAYALGYWTEQNPFDAEVMTEEEQDEFRQILQQQADRVAKLFGYEYAWSS